MPVRRSRVPRLDETPSFARSGNGPTKYRCPDGHVRDQRRRTAAPGRRAPSGRGDARTRRPPSRRRGRLRAPVELEVIIPAYNESARLPETLRQSVAYLNERPWQSRIVVVDNGSVDETAADARVAAAATDKVDVVVIGCSRAGKGAAVRRGLLTSTSPLVGFYAADLAMPLETLVPTVEALLAGADAVIASRHVPGASFVVPQPLRRRAGGDATPPAIRAPRPWRRGSSGPGPGRPTSPPRAGDRGLRDAGGRAVPERGDPAASRDVLPLGELSVRVRRVAHPRIRAPARAVGGRRAPSLPSAGDRSRLRPGPLLPVADRDAARRADPHRALQLGLRAPHRRHVRLPHRGHRRRARHRGVLRRDPRRPALAGPRLGRGAARSAARTARTGRASAATSTATSLGAAGRRRARVRVLLHGRGDRGAAPGGRPRPEAGLRQRRPRPHRRAEGRVPGRGATSGAAAADARRRHHLHRPGPRRDHLQGGLGARLRPRPRRRRRRSTRWSTRSTTR